MRTFAAKFPGTCSKCLERFPKGTTIAYDGKPWHPECLEADRAAEKAQAAADDARDAERWAEASRRAKAGLNIRTTVGRNETLECLTLTVRGGYNYAQELAEAWAVVYSIRAAGGTAELLKHKSAKGKWHFGKRLGYYAVPGSSTSWVDGGTGFELLVNETFEEWKARRVAARAAKKAVA